jgi:hypothetical protein
MEWDTAKRSYMALHTINTHGGSINALPQDIYVGGLVHLQKVLQVKAIVRSLPAHVPRSNEHPACVQ